MPEEINTETIGSFENVLNERLEDYLKGEQQQLLRQIFAEWIDSGWNAFLFGGMLRDVVLYGREANPRDIDIVVSNKSLDELRGSLSPHIQRENRFGGLHVRIASLKFDIWPLNRTWAFTKPLGISAVPSNLPRTTFLNIEGLAASLPQRHVAREVFECGFIRAVRTKELDINLSDNPYPALSAARSLLIAKQLQYALSERLKRYILETVASEGVEALISAQRSHYSDVLLRSQEIVQMVRELKTLGETRQLSSG